MFDGLSFVMVVLTVFFKIFYDWLVPSHLLFVLFPSPFWEDVNLAGQRKCSGGA